MPAKASWKWVNLSITVVDGELGKLVLAKERGFRETKYREGLCVNCARRQDQQSVQNIHEINTYG